MIAFHPLANIFPLIEGADFDALVADIKAHGLADKIVMHEGRPLDGRNRWRALMKLGLTDEEILRAHTEPLDEGTDPLAFVISKNLKRRHLDESQRAMVAARLATLRDGQRQVGQLAHVPTQEQAGELLNVSERSIKRARIVLDHGADELMHAVDQGEVSVSAAAEVATQWVEHQRELVAAGRKEIIAAASGFRSRKRQQKIAMARALDSAPSAPLPDPIILSADADFDSINRGIDSLYSWWTGLALRVIEEAHAVGMVKAIQKVKALHDKATGLEMQSHCAKNTEAQRQARELRLLAERKLGQWLFKTGRKGHRYMGRPSKGVKIGKHDPDLITLRKLGITKQESKDWQKIARLSDAQFEALLAGKPGRCHLPHYRRHRVRRFRPRRGSAPHKLKPSREARARTPRRPR